MHTGFQNLRLCVFNNNYLVKVGGDKGDIEDEHDLLLELYDIKNNKWYEITQAQIEYSDTTTFKPVRTV